MILYCRFLLASIVLMGMLMACGSEPDAQGRVGHLKGKQLDYLLAVRKDKRTLTSFLSDTTYKTYDTSHGTQIEYLNKDGSASLWYPGNRRIVSGKWEVRSNKANRAPSVCFQYGPNTYNPVTKTRGGRWTCTHGGAFIRVADEIVRGDIFNLQSKTIPFVLPRKIKISFKRLLKQANLKADLVHTWKYK